VQTLHARVTVQGRTGEVWAKRPNMLRIKYDDGRYEISNGPTLWIVNEKANRATKKLSHYYRDAQERGADVIDMLAELPYSDNFSGFFSDAPVERIRKDGGTYDVWRVEFESHGDRIRFEALADARTHRLHSLKAEHEKGGRWEIVLDMTVLEYDQPIPDEKFIFVPPEGMKVIVEEDREEEGRAPAPEGSALSGRIVWASSGKPVGGARLTVSGGRIVEKPDGTRVHEFFARAETDRQGRWRVAGAPGGQVSMTVRSWEFEWPAEPVFASNVGSLSKPAVIVDGQSEYGGLDFKVYKPEDFYAHVAVNVTDEAGKPVEGVRARLCDPGLERTQSMDAAGREQHTGPDGKVEGEDIWPTNEPVRVRLFNRDADSPYAAWAVMSEPFVVERNKSYDFDMVVPYGREMKLRAVDPGGQPVADLRVSVLLGRGDWVTNLMRRMSTDSEGEIAIAGLPANKEVTIVLQRFPRDETGRRTRASMTSTCFTTEVPADKEPKTIEVMFDERPIRIEGTLESPAIPAGAELSYITHVAHGLRSDWGASIRDGSFALVGAPPGEVSLSYRFHVPGGKPSTRFRHCKGVIQTEPGHTYVVRIVQDRLELLKAEPSATGVEAPE